MQSAAFGKRIDCELISFGLHLFSTTGRANKPMMEKRRRARINQSLAMLKSILTKDFMKNNPNYQGKQLKLEKADILEMAVRQFMMRQAIERPGKDHYQTGFTDCINQVVRFLSIPDGHPSSSNDNYDGNLRSRLMSFLEIIYNEVNHDRKKVPPFANLNSNNKKKKQNRSRANRSYNKKIHNCTTEEPQLINIDPTEHIFEIQNNIRYNQNPQVSIQTPRCETITSNALQTTVQDYGYFDNNIQSGLNDASDPSTLSQPLIQKLIMLSASMAPKPYEYSQEYFQNVNYFSPNIQSYETIEPVAQSSRQETFPTVNTYSEIPTMEISGMAMVIEQTSAEVSYIEPNHLPNQNNLAPITNQIQEEAFDFSMKSLNCIASNYLNNGDAQNEPLWRPWFESF